MKRALSTLIILAFIFNLIGPSLALSDYQRGVLDGLSRGWNMSQRYDQAKAGDIAPYNQAVAEYNAWIEAIFGRNESLMLQPFAASVKPTTYYASRTFTPVHSIDASWNQSKSLLPEPDAYGMINGIPVETYYSIGPALSNF
ncbi:MAG: hypothetical protein LUO89_09860 [Methanothrix sp.]|nr:hypothetical protein [Methanothrix sp.]